MIPLTEEFAEQKAIGLVQLIERDVLDQWNRYERVREHRSLYYGTATANMIQLAANGMMMVVGSFTHVYVQNLNTTYTATVEFVATD